MVTEIILDKLRYNLYPYGLYTQQKLKLDIITSNKRINILDKEICNLFTHVGTAIKLILMQRALSTKE